MTSPAIIALAKNVLAEARRRNLRIVTAESCTGGLVAAALTEIPGSSDVFERGFVTYSNDAKNSDLGVSTQLIAQHGAVSEETARAMAEGALSHSRAEVSVSITGIAGPGGGSDLKPVGLVHFAAARKGHPTLSRKQLFGDIGRPQIRYASTEVALTMLLRLVAD
ncbi:MAG: CinA family protein [Micropepsaceae bacterium]